ncbi:MAG: glutathione S-transferase N-terminal domain-containing protein [Pseudomonadota bacterium]
MIKVWGRATSSNVQAAMWCVGELGLAHERIDVGGAFGGLDTPDFIAMNPHQRIPVVQDGPATLWESNAIIRYLASRYGRDDFWPEDPVQRAQIDMWMEWVKTTLYPVFVGGVFWTLVRTPKAERNMAQHEANLATVDSLMKLAEAQLSASKGLFFVADTFTPADISFGHLLYRYFTLEIERPDLPRLREYYDSLTGRDAYRTHVMISYDSLRVE